MIQTLRRSSMDGTPLLYLGIVWLAAVTLALVGYGVRYLWLNRQRKRHHRRA